jgi:hypothetical protein
MIVVNLKAGLGNQLFQYAAGRALSLTLQTELKLDLSFYNHPINSKIFRLDIFKLPYSVAHNKEIDELKNKKGHYLIRKLINLGIKLYPYSKTSHIIEEEILNIKRIDSDYYLDGWFANECFFKEFRSTLLKDFCQDYIIGKRHSKILTLIDDTNSVAVHVRRGDYLALDYFYNLTKEYYYEAMIFIEKRVKDPHFFFFSDDIHWVREAFSNIPNAYFVENDDTNIQQSRNVSDVSELLLMGKCKHNIIANSTYSWWGAWLNTNNEKIIVAPIKWYNDYNAQLNYEKGSLIPDNLEKI